jgi:hypothetical protein
MALADHLRISSLTRTREIHHSMVQIDQRSAQHAAPESDKSRTSPARTGGGTAALVQPHGLDALMIGAGTAFAALTPTS